MSGQPNTGGLLNSRQSERFIKGTASLGFPYTMKVWVAERTAWRTLGRTEVKGWKNDPHLKNPERGNKYEPAPEPVGRWPWETNE